MGILRGNRHSGSAAIELTGREVEETPLGRCEAQAIAPRTRVVDPYAEWVARREQQQTRERPEVRWVVGAGGGIRAAAAAPRRDGGRQASGGLAGVV
ncbi:MAG TPA: hypothetical protein VN618_02395 [Solirubrobacteraceae bacterium]|nr:hypothetical protein [Solirubrobacteraceae bacterium]